MKWWRNSIRTVGHFFPITLLVQHIKFNLFGCLLWLLLIGIFSDRIGRGFGISYLFLSPEYRGQVGFASFFFIGFAFGGLVMAFNSYSYTRLAARFPFLALVKRPFLRFSMNNVLIPLFGLLVFTVQLFSFQMREEYASFWAVFLYWSFFLMGMTLFILVSLSFFFRNKNLFDLRDKEKTELKRRWSRLKYTKNVRNNWNDDVYWYIDNWVSIRKCRPTKHYSAQKIQEVFDQNRFSTSFFEIITIASFLVLGLFGGSQFFDFPAGMSILLLLTILTMVMNALSSWLRFWTIPLVVSVLFMMNWTSTQFHWFQFRSAIRGMDYSSRSTYSFKTIAERSLDTAVLNDSYHQTIQRLNNWKKQTGEEKPVLIVLNVSGGGSRSATWVYKVLSELDAVSQRKLSKHVVLITGASGGMVGAAYYRSLLKEQSTFKLNKEEFFDEISSDLLNKLAFAASTNDLFFRYQTSSRGEDGVSYDRGQAFERDLNENTSNRLNVAMKSYQQLEYNGKLPSMIFSPSVVNDGRVILFSSQDLAFMQRSVSRPGIYSIFPQLDARSLIGSRNVDQAKLSSILRVNATFPLVLPMSELPTEPRIHCMDAGVRDNYGTYVGLHWLNQVENWIEKETSGVVVLQIRDTKKVFENAHTRSLSFLDKWTEPLTNLYSNFPATQDFDHEIALESYVKQAKFPVHIISFNLRNALNERISLSWHLTKREKLAIKKAWYQKGNQAAKNELFHWLNRGPNSD